MELYVCKLELLSVIGTDACTILLDGLLLPN